jgi:hypothetical protein
LVGWLVGWLVRVRGVCLRGCPLCVPVPTLVRASPRVPTTPQPTPTTPQPTDHPNHLTPPGPRHQVRAHVHLELRRAVAAAALHAATHARRLLLQVGARKRSEYSTCARLAFAPPGPVASSGTARTPHEPATLRPSPASRPGPGRGLGHLARHAACRVRLQPVRPAGARRRCGAPRHWPSCRRCRWPGWVERSYKRD